MKVFKKPSNTLQLNSRVSPPYREFYVRTTLATKKILRENGINKNFSQNDNMENIADCLLASRQPAFIIGDYDLKFTYMDLVTYEIRENFPNIEAEISKLFLDFIKVKAKNFLSHIKSLDEEFSSKDGCIYFHPSFEELLEKCASTCYPDSGIEYFRLVDNAPNSYTCYEIRLMERANELLKSLINKGYGKIDNGELLLCVQDENENVQIDNWGF